MEFKDKHYTYLAIALGVLVGAIINKVSKKFNRDSSFDGDEPNSYAEGERKVIGKPIGGMGGTSDTTDTVRHNRPMHRNNDMRDGNSRSNSSGDSDKASNFFRAYNLPDSKPYDQAAEDWFESQHPGAENVDVETAVEYFEAKGEPLAKRVKMMWAQRHGIHDAKVAESFWSKSLTNGDPDQMMLLYRAFYPKSGNGKRGHMKQGSGKMAAMPQQG